MNIISFVIDSVRWFAVLLQICSENNEDPKHKSTVGSDSEVPALMADVRNLRLKENAAKTRKQKAETRSITLDKRRQLSALLKNKGRE